MKKAGKNSGHSFEDYFKRALNPLVILSILQERPKYAYLLQHCFPKTTTICRPIQYLFIQRISAATTSIGSREDDQITRSDHIRIPGLAISGVILHDLLVGPLERI